MEELAIHISSVNRGKRGTRRPGDFTIKFNPTLKLDPEMKHKLALGRLPMTYSWYNIRSDYKNNTIKYTHDKGVSWQTIGFTDGMYSYSACRVIITRLLLFVPRLVFNSEGQKLYMENYLKPFL